MSCAILFQNIHIDECIAVQLPGPEDVTNSIALHCMLGSSLLVVIDDLLMLYHSMHRSKFLKIVRESLLESSHPFANTTCRSNLQASTFQFMQTIFDTSVLILVLYKTIKESLGPKSARGIRSIIATHGILYYLYVGFRFKGTFLRLKYRSLSVVFGVNIAWAIMVLTASVSLNLFFTVSVSDAPTPTDRFEVHDGRVSTVVTHIVTIS